MHLEASVLNEYLLDTYIGEYQLAPLELTQCYAGFDRFTGNTTLSLKNLCFLQDRKFDVLKGLILKVCIMRRTTS